MVTRRLLIRPIDAVRPLEPFRPIETIPVLIPGLFNPSHTTSLFDTARRGQPVVRPDDMAALRVELVNLDIVPGAPPRVRATAKAFIVLHFAPQSFGEQAFFQTAQPAKSGGAPDETVDTPRGTQAGETGPNAVDPPPVLARIAGESRLAFAVPAGFEAPYTLAGLLAACEQLAPSVPASALPRQEPVLEWPWPLVISVGELAALPARQRASLSRLAVRLQRAPMASAGLLVRQQLGGLLGAAVGRLPGVFAPSERIPRLPRIQPRPADPSATQTAIEMPWRLVLAPHAAERFRHAAQPVVSPATQRIELWHTRMVLPDSKGFVAPAPQPDPQRTVRAVWARTDDTHTQMRPEFPTGADLPPPSDLPFRATMDDNDRFQIAHLSSNFSVPDYPPQPVQADRLMLSPLGGWLDARGAWEPPGLDVEEWVNHATMGRDHYVRVVYRGLFVCLGHRVSLVKVTERKFHNGRNGTTVEPGNTAYLRQRLFIVVREHERTYVEPGLMDGDGRVLHNQFPFTRVRILTTITPDLDLPDSPASSIPGYGDRRMFWPCVGGKPFRFDCMGEDLEGRQVTFSLPLIFMINSLASPRKVTRTGFTPNYPEAEKHAQAAAAEWLARTDSVSGRTIPRRRAPLGGQQVAFAPGLQSGDTSAPVESLDFGVRAQGSPVNGNINLRDYSEKLTRPVFFPSVQIARVRLPAVAQLAGSGGSNVLSFNEHYLKNGYAGNPGEVFMEVDAVADPNPPPEARLASLDFSKQTDRSGGFVMPNLQPSAWSRMAGPVSGLADDFRKGVFNPGSAFPSAAGALGSLPLPLIFGCIPLGEVIETVSDFAGGAAKLPKFVAEGGSKVESFINELIRLYDVVRRLADDPSRIATAAIAVARETLKDLAQQALAFAAAQAAPVQAAIAQAQTALDKLALAVAPLKDVDIDAAPALPDLPAAAAQLQTALAQLGDAVNDASALPAGFRQAVRTVAAQAGSLLADVLALPPLLAAAKALYAALDDVVGHPELLGDLLGHPDQLAAKLTAVQGASDGLRTALGGTQLLDGAPRKAVLQALDAVSGALGLAADLLKLLEQLTGEELVIRFNWTPDIKSWGFDPASPILRINDVHGFIVAVEARVKRSGGAPRVSVLCGLKHFDLVLIAPASFIELNFEKIEFTVDSSARMDVDVVLSAIKFVGPLSFVETLRDLIPLDGFSDPPALDISERGIDASFGVGLPAIAVGMFNLSNLSLGAGFTVPFIGQPLAVRFNFCTREQPFNLSVMTFGGGGFFGITIDPHGVQILEASFEFGASLSVNFGVASGGVHIMAGLYYRMENNLSSLTGYFRVGGYVSVLGLISASIELYLELRFVPETGKCSGKAQLTIEVSVFLFSGSVTITCERTFAGANGDPTFRQAMGLLPALALADELAAIDDDTRYAWRDYCEAFA
jgi:hypothetical protein